MEKLGGYPACPNSRKKPDLRAIRRGDRRASPTLVFPNPLDPVFGSPHPRHGRRFGEAVQLLQHLLLGLLLGRAAERAGASPSVPRGRLPDLENRRYLLDSPRDSAYT